MLEQLYAHDFFRYFEEISQIPRGSGHNEKISGYLMDFARAHGLEAWQDSAWNVVICKPASAGCEEAPGVILQGHMDMVCEKDAGVEHDFQKQGLELRLDEEAVFARGTTLGGDDGIALAYGLAILAAKDLVHPPLQLAVTTDEETGMSGAKALDTSRLCGKYYINIDSEEEGVLLAGCAGGLRVCLSRALRPVRQKGQKVALTLGGLKGGHSGSEIDKNRTNGVLLMARLLLELGQKESCWLRLLEGGNKDNAIPREAVAELVVPPQRVASLEQAFRELLSRYQQELAGFEPDLCGECSLKEAGEWTALDREEAQKVLSVLLLAPNGVQAMSGDIPGLVESSLNMGIFRMAAEEGHMKAHYSLRSSVTGYKEFMAGKLRQLAELTGMEYWEGDRYPAWAFRRDSRLREIMAQVYQEQYGVPPKIEAIHAGLECGIISHARPDLDMVSIGPDIPDIHTPRERLIIGSAIRTYEYLKNVLERLGGER